MSASNERRRGEFRRRRNWQRDDGEFSLEVQHAHPSGAEAETLLDEAAEEGTAYRSLASECRTTDGIGQLLSSASAAAGQLDAMSLRVDDATNEQLARAQAIRMTIEHDHEALQIFRADDYWLTRRLPSPNKLTLACVYFCFRREDRGGKLASKYSRALNWLALQGIGPERLREVLQQEGGISGCANKYSKMRKRQREAAVPPPETADEPEAPVKSPEAQAARVSDTGTELQTAGEATEPPVLQAVFSPGDDLSAFVARHDLRIELGPGVRRLIEILIRKRLDQKKAEESKQPHCLMVALEGRVLRLY